VENATVIKVNTDGGKQGGEGSSFKWFIEQERDRVTLKFGYIPWLAVSKKVSPLDTRANL
jgi:hypothetical protein